MKQFLFIFIICALPSNIVWSQCTSSQERPKWADGFFQEEANSYIEVVSATGYDEEIARNKAAKIAVERRSMSTGARMNVTVTNGMVQVDGKDAVTVKSRVIDEYREHCSDGQYRVYLLMQTAKNPTFDFERVNVTNKYDFSPSVFVPGMEQIHKGSIGKGVAFIAGEIVFVGGIVVAESLRASNESKINSTHNASAKIDYIDNADTYENVRNVAIAGAAAVYLWNVIDGIAAKGKKHVLIGENQLQITPYLTPYRGGGLAMKISF